MKFELLIKHKPTILVGVPTLFEALTKNEHMDGVDLSRLKYVIGGGDTSAVAYKFGYGNDFYHISTGGGATLEYIADKTLTALEWLK